MKKIIAISLLSLISTSAFSMLDIGKAVKYSSKFPHYDIKEASISAFRSDMLLSAKIGVGFAGASLVYNSGKKLWNGPEQSVRDTRIKQVTKEINDEFKEHVGLTLKRELACTKQPVDLGKLKEDLWPKFEREKNLKIKNVREANIDLSLNEKRKFYALHGSLFAAGIAATGYGLKALWDLVK